jgi:hypothetical protein
MHAVHVSLPGDRRHDAYAFGLRMNTPDTRAAVKRWPKSDDDRVYVHAVLLTILCTIWSGKRRDG